MFTHARLAWTHLVSTKHVSMADLVEEGVGYLACCTRDTHLQWGSLWGWTGSSERTCAIGWRYPNNAFWLVGHSQPGIVCKPAPMQTTRNRTESCHTHMHVLQPGLHVIRWSAAVILARRPAVPSPTIQTWNAICGSRKPG